MSLNFDTLSITDHENLSSVVHKGDQEVFPEEKGLVPMQVDEGYAEEEECAEEGEKEMANISDNCESEEGDEEDEQVARCCMCCQHNINVSVRSASLI